MREARIPIIGQEELFLSDLLGSSLGPPRVTAASGIALPPRLYIRFLTFFKPFSPSWKNQAH